MPVNLVIWKSNVSSILLLSLAPMYKNMVTLLLISVDTDFALNTGSNLPWSFSHTKTNFLKIKRK